MRSLGSVACVLSLLSACAAPVESVDVEDGALAGGKADAVCSDVSLVWGKTVEYPEFYGLNRLVASPNGEMLVRFSPYGGTALRLDDGSEIMRLGNTHSVSRDFSLRVEGHPRGGQSVVRADGGLVA